MTRLRRGVAVAGGPVWWTLGSVVLPLARVRLWWENAFWPLPFLGMLLAYRLQGLTVSLTRRWRTSEGRSSRPLQH